MMRPEERTRVENDKIDGLKEKEVLRHTDLRREVSKELGVH